MLVLTKLVNFIKRGGSINQLYNGYINNTVGCICITYVRNHNLDFMVMLEGNFNQPDEYCLHVYYKHHKILKYNRLKEYYESIFYSCDSRLFLNLLILLVEKYIDPDLNKLCKSCILMVDSMRVIKNYTFEYRNKIKNYVLDIDF
jgi:hypothetical protein